MSGRFRDQVGFSECEKTVPVYSVRALAKRIFEEGGFGADAMRRRHFRPAVRLATGKKRQVRVDTPVRTANISKLIEAQEFSGL